MIGVATERATKWRKLSEEQAIAEEERAIQRRRRGKKRQQEKEQEEIGEIERLHHELDATQDQLDMVTKQLEKTHEEL